MGKKTEKQKNKPESKKQTIQDFQNSEKTRAERVLELAKELETELKITHRWVTSADGKTSKLVKIK